MNKKELVLFIFIVVFVSVIVASSVVGYGTDIGCDGTCPPTSCTGSGGTCKAACDTTTETEITDTNCSGTTPKCCKTESTPPGTLTRKFCYDVNVQWNDECTEEFDLGDYITNTLRIDRDCITRIEIKNVKVDDVAEIYLKTDGGYKLVKAYTDFNCKGINCGNWWRDSGINDQCEKCPAGFPFGDVACVYCTYCDTCNSGQYGTCTDCGGTSNACKDCYFFSTDVDRCGSCKAYTGRTTCQSYQSTKANVVRSGTVLTDDQEFKNVLYSGGELKLKFNVTNKCHNTKSYINVEFEISKISPNVADKGQKCSSGNIAPVCGWNDDGNRTFDPGETFVDMNHCARWGPWYENWSNGDAIICTSETELSCSGINASNIGNTPYEVINGYNVVYCVDQCKDTDCESKDTVSKNCLNDTYIKDAKIDKIVPGYYATEIYAVNLEQSRCTHEISHPAYDDFRVRSVMSPKGPSGYYRAENTSVFCERGCAYGMCNENTAPVLTSISATPLYVKYGGNVIVRSVGSDSDTIINETANMTMKDPVRLVCSSESGGDITEETGCYPDPDTGDPICPENPTPTPAFDADLCNGKYKLNNPNCTIIITNNSWQGNKTIYCRLMDKGMMYSSEKSFIVTVDNANPKVEIISPDENSLQIQNFIVRVNDNDENGMKQCQYNVMSRDIVTRSWTNRTCNSGFVVAVGKRKDCGLGTCRVEVIGFDKAGNNYTDSREFMVNYIFSNITSPLSGTWQAKNFTVSVSDMDSSGASVANCTYMVMKSAGVTRDWTNRTCNSNFKVSVGVNGDCNEEGNATCWIFVKAKNNESDEGLQGFAVYNISWSIPESTILSPASHIWQKANFIVQVQDEEFLDLGFEKCEYMVRSKTVLTKPWTTRVCNSNFEITIGNNTNAVCRDEGAGSCNVSVRAKSKTGNVGNVDNRLFSILLSDVDPDGFSSVGYVKTETGVKFSGVRKKNLFTPTFRVCNNGVSIEACKSSYTVLSSNCGLDEPCFCGAFNKYECEIVCGDRKGQFYLLATGMLGLSETGMISIAKEFECPFMNLIGLNEILNFFKWLNQTLSVQIFMYDNLIRNTDDTNLINEYTLYMKIYRDARLLVIEHIYYLENILAAPSMTKAREAFANTTEVKKKILAILREGYEPTELEIDATIPPGARFNTTIDISITISKTGELGLYANMICDITMPNTIKFNSTTTCLDLTTSNSHVHPLTFNASQLGGWNIKCELFGSIRSDCKRSIKYDSKTGSIIIYPPYDPYITNVFVPSSALNGSSVNVLVTTHNPEAFSYYARAGCTFRNPSGINYEANSSCNRIYEQTDTTFTVSKLVDKAGTWSIPSCSLYASTNAACTFASLRNVSIVGAQFNVTLLGHIYISLVNVSSEVINNTRTNLRVIVNNPIETRFVLVEYRIQKSNGDNVINTSACTGITSGDARTFSFEIIPDIVGTWYVSNVSARASVNADCSYSVLQHNVSGPSFNVIRGTNLTVLSVSPLDDIRINTTKILNIIIDNPLNTDKYGYVRCIFRDPRNNIFTNSTACTWLRKNLATTLSLSVFGSMPGTWIIDSCTLYGSINSDCSSSTIYHTRTQIGSFNVLAVMEPYITTAQLSATSVRVNQQVNVIVNVTNPDTDTKYVKLQCTFKDPDNMNRYYTSACTNIAGYRNISITASVTPDKIGTWSIPSCLLNVSTQSSCVPVTAHSSKTNIGTFSVTMPNSLYITSINAPTDALNDTDETITVNTYNPLSDIYSRVRCAIKKPDATIQELTSNCLGISSNTSRLFQLTFHPTQIGLWNVLLCSVEGATQSNCGNAVHHYNTTGPLFNVVQSTNLTILSVTDMTPIRINTTKTLSIDVRNPASIDKFGKVTCSLRKPNTQITTNTTSCTRIPASTTYTFSMRAYADVYGTWDVLSCYVSGSLDANCTPSAIHDTMSNIGSYDVITELNLTISGTRLMHDTIFIDNYISVIIDTRNPDSDDKYGIVSCEFKPPTNITYYNSSACEFIEKEHDKSFEVKYFANISGTWYIRNCTLNASSNIACLPTKIHAKKENIGLVFVRAMELMITSVVPPQTSLNVGDTAEIKVYVKNSASSNRTAYVNCSLKDPSNRTHVLVTANKIIIPGATELFIPSIRVGVPGTWSVLSCAVYKIMSPATKEHELSINKLFSVLSPTPTECAINADCPGTDDKCYCSGNSCQPCMVGKVCQNFECVSTPAPECITDTGCPAGHVCRNEKCVRMGDCTYDANCQLGYRCENYNCVMIGDCITDTDCRQGYECRNYSCQLTEEKSWLSQNLINFIIILFIIILIPILLFSYAKRSI